ncbi:stress response NST1-like protein (DUF1645) [Rhynchospora pubera]|uniref:Stress response NST1-like protein (DUF1645) n=1 Tax=Rhynchospora pubera TaxID=906938 RepID=A0AAV8CHZ6_9POAL|nr:stress response NST1-like protein (DUF1645) [Rhynchospora pubera]
MELENPTNGDEIDSSCSTPYVSAPSSPGRPSNATASAPFSGGYFFSAPASPMHFIISTSGAASSASPSAGGLSGDIEFEFSSRYLSSMISADELFCNGQIRPISNLDTPPLSPIPDDEQEISIRGRDIKLRSGSVHRRARSMSPLRNNRYKWHNDDDEEEDIDQGEIKSRPNDLDLDQEQDQKERADATTPSVSASSSRSSSSSSSRSSKRWIFLKDLLYRSKSEGRERERGPIRERFWTHMPFSREREKEKEKEKEKPKQGNNELPNNTNANTPVMRTNAGTPSVRKRQSAHERLYNMNRAHAEEMRRRTFLPYRQGLLGCLGFSSKSYGALNGFTKSLNPVFSR